MRRLPFKSSSTRYIHREQKSRIFFHCRNPRKSHGCTFYQKRKTKSLLVAFTAFWRVLCILRSLDVRADMCHREALVLFAGAGGTFPEVLFALVECEFLSAINAHIFARADFLSCVVRLLFGHTIHQNSHARQRYIWVVLVLQVLHRSSDNVKGAGTDAKVISSFLTSNHLWEKR